MSRSIGEVIGPLLTLLFASADVCSLSHLQLVESKAQGECWRRGRSYRTDPLHLCRRGLLVC